MSIMTCRQTGTEEFVDGKNVYVKLEKLFNSLFEYSYCILLLLQVCM
jgi:hypothetical protein